MGREADLAFTEFAMMRTSHLLSILLTALAGLLLCRLPANAAPAESVRPNIIILLADDLGYGELGCQGNPQIPTPHIDSIANSGVRFTSGYVTAPFCSASRAGLMTGRYQTRFGYEFNPIGPANEDPQIGLPASERTLAQHLHDAGYTTSLIGKWHLGGTAAYHPHRRGFDEFFGFLHEGHYYVPPPYREVTTMLRRRTLPGGGQGRWTSADERTVYTTHMGHDEPAYDADNPILRSGQPVNEPLYLTDAFTREAVDFIGRNRDRPFFLYVAYNAVHSPLQGADAYMNRMSSVQDVHRRIFAAMLVNLDDSVGAILQKLRDEELDRNTLVFFLSDNGGPTRELTSSNRPLRGEKGDLYEGGIRVPFLMQWKDRLPAGRVFDPAVISLDVFATAAAAAGSPLTETPSRDGVDLLPFLRGQAEGQPHEVLYWRVGNKAAIRAGDWKLVRNARRGDAPWELYHLGEDIGEATNRADQTPQRVEQLMTRWKQIDAQMAESAWR